MARKALIHKNTNLTTNNGGVLSPKLPTAGTLQKGEIAVNYKNGYETLSIENDAGEVIPFASLEQTMAYTDASIVNADWNATSGKAQILNKPDIPDEKLSSSYQTSTLENDNLLLAGGDTYETAFSKIEKAILDNEETIAASLNDLNTRKIEIDDVPTKTSQLTNDSNFTTLSEVTLTIVNSAPGTLDTLNELATALGNDPNFATTITTQIGNKADKSNMTAGTYRSVTVNNQGIVTGGTNPTTLAGYGITDAINTSSTAQTKAGNLTAAKFIKSGGTSSQFLKADGSIDSNTYLTSATEQTITGNKKFSNSKLEIDNGEFKFNNHIERHLGNVNTLPNYTDWDSDKKDGTWHRIWRISFPEGANFWGRLTVGFIGGYSSFNASGYIEKEICIAFNGSTLFNNVGRYSALGLNVEKDFRISELIWNSDTNQWQIIIFSAVPYGNNRPIDIVIRCETSASDIYKNAFEGITITINPEISQISSYINTKATVDGTSKTFYFADLPVYQDPYGNEIAVIDDIPTKTSQLTNDSGFLTSHQLLKTINNESLIGSGNITIQGGSGGDVNVIETVKVNGTALTPDSNKAVDITVPAAVTESTVSGWGFTKNTGTYSKPSDGIPSSDLANSVQTSLGKADTALQSFTESDPTVPSHVKEITTTDISNWNNKLSSAPVTSVNGQTGAVSLTIPSAVTESTVSGWGFTKNSGTVTGVKMNGTTNNPTSGVVDLGTVLTSFTETDPTVPSHVKLITTTDISNWNGKQAAIADLSDIRSGAALGATALQSYTETDPTVPSWAKATNKPTYTAAEVGALPDTYTPPVTSVNGQTGAVSLTIPAAVTESTVSGWGFTKNTGTVTGVKINGTTKNPTSGVVDLGSVLTSETSLSKGTTSGSGNAVTDISVSGHTITLTKGSTFLTSHLNIKTVNGNSLVGTGNVSIDTLPTVTASDNGKVLQVVNGAWSLVMPTAIYSGTSTPNNSVGNDGDLYLLTS